MIFQSIEFILFLIISFLIYWTVCNRSKTLQNLLIVLASLIFYLWCDWRYLALLLTTALSTFFIGLAIGKSNNKKRSKIFLIGAILLNLGVLFFFKYYNFFIEILIDTCSFFYGNANFNTINILVPVGISFYTFTALSYVFDVYQDKVVSTPDILAYLAYVMFFPSILSGPISRAQTQLQQFYVARKFDYDSSIRACKLFLWGCLMKLCLADRLGIYVDSVYSNIGQHNGTTLLFTSILYSVQIYADFAGYSLMAIASGKLLGIELPINFKRPYFSKTITEFWRRWHISLTTWFRDYIYFPLGGNRCSQVRWIFNTLVVFIVSSLWHGAAYSFLMWGGIHGIAMVMERLIYGEKIREISAQ